MAASWAAAPPTDRARLTLDRESLACQHRAHAFAQVALQLDAAFEHRAARPAHTLQFLTEFLQERRVARQPVHDGHNLSAATLLLHAQLGDDAPWQRGIGGTLTAATRLLRRAAVGTHPPGACGVDDALVGGGHF